MFVIVRQGDNKYVARSGSKKSYTYNLAYAQKFNTREEAEKNKCGNEYISPLNDVWLKYC